MPAESNEACSVAVRGPPRRCAASVMNQFHEGSPSEGQQVSTLSLPLLPYPRRLYTPRLSPLIGRRPEAQMRQHDGNKPVISSHSRRRPEAVLILKQNWSPPLASTERPRALRARLQARQKKVGVVIAPEGVIEANQEDISITMADYKTRESRLGSCRPKAQGRNDGRTQVPHQRSAAADWARTGTIVKICTRDA